MSDREFIDEMLRSARRSDATTKITDDDIDRRARHDHCLDILTDRLMGESSTTTWDELSEAERSRRRATAEASLLSGPTAEDVNEIHIRRSRDAGLARGYISIGLSRRSPTSETIEQAKRDGADSTLHLVRMHEFDGGSYVIVCEFFFDTGRARLHAAALKFHMIPDGDAYQFVWDVNTEGMNDEEDRAARDTACDTALRILESSFQSDYARGRVCWDSIGMHRIACVEFDEMPGWVSRILGAETSCSVRSKLVPRDEEIH